VIDPSAINAEDMTMLELALSPPLRAAAIRIESGLVEHFNEVGAWLPSLRIKQLWDEASDWQTVALSSGVFQIGDNPLLPLPEKATLSWMRGVDEPRFAIEGQVGWHALLSSGLWIRQDGAEQSTSLTIYHQNWVETVRHYNAPRVGTIGYRRRLSPLATERLA
jgi:hypothetical protein